MKFAKSVSDVFDLNSDPHFEAAVEYVVTHPPKQQIIKDGLLEYWGDVATTTALKSDRVLHYVRQVRNNLIPWDLDKRVRADGCLAGYATPPNGARNLRTLIISPAPLDGGSGLRTIVAMRANWSGKG